MKPKKVYAAPTLQKRQRLADVTTQGTIPTGGTLG
jgi:hypothetical protein